MPRKEKPKVKLIRSVSDLIDCLGKDLKNNEACWFRGHSKSSWKLLPSLARKREWLNAEMDLIAKFKQNSAMLLARLPETEWEWLTIMQHHGVPTRLLDWTENPLVALYFAVCEKFRSEGTLWVLFPRLLNNISNINPDYPKYIPTFEDKELRAYTPQSIKSEQTSRMKPIAVIGPRNTPRMQAQLGVFSIIHRDPWSINQLGTKEHFLQYTIPPNAKESILRELSLLGIGRLQLFPELQSIGYLLKGELK